MTLSSTQHDRAKAFAPISCLLRWRQLLWALAFACILLITPMLLLAWAAAAPESMTGVASRLEWESVAHAAPALQAGNVVTVPVAVTGTEDSAIGLGITVDPQLSQGGSQLDLIGTEAGFRDAGAGATPTNFTIPAGATIVRLTGYGGNDNGANAGSQEEYQGTTLVVNLENNTYAGHTFYIFNQGTASNDNYAFSGVPLGAASDSGTVTGDQDTALNSITVARSGNTLSIVETQSVMDQAYLVEYLTNNSSADFLGSVGTVLDPGLLTGTLTLPATASFAVISIQDGRGGLADTEEDKGIGRFVVDLDSGLVSGTIFAQTGRGGNFNAGYAFSGYDLSANVSILSSGATIVGDTTANGNTQPDWTITRSGNVLTLVRAATPGGIFSSLVSAQSYARVASSSSAAALGAASTVGIYDDDLLGATSAFTLTVPGTAQGGNLTIAMYNVNDANNDQENSGTAQIFVDLVNGTTSGSFLVMRSSIPDLVSWTDVPFGVRLIDSPNTTTNHAADTDFSDELPGVLQFDLVTMPNGARRLRASATTVTPDAHFSRDYQLTLQVQWYGRKPINFTNLPAGASLSDTIYDETAAAWQADPVDAAAVAMTPPLHYSGNGIVLDVGYDGTTDPLQVNVTRVADAPLLVTTDQSGDEDTPFDISTVLTATLVDTDTSEVLTVIELSGIAVDHTVSDGVNNFTATALTDTVNIASWSLGALTYQGAQDANGIFPLGVRVASTDNDGFSPTTDSAATTDTVTVTINPINDAPIITQPAADPAAITIPENTVVVTDVNTLDVEDSEGSGLTYTVSGPDAGSFAIDASGNLSFTTAPDFEAPGDVGADNVYNVTVMVTDSGGLTDTVALDITVEDASDTPDLALAIDEPMPDLVSGVESSMPVTVSNVGGAAASGPLTTTIDLPAGVSAPASFSDGGWSCTTSGQSVSCIYPSALAIGTSTLFNVPVTPDDTTVGTTPGPFTVTVAAVTDEEDLSNNGPLTLTPSVAVGRDAQLTVVKSVDEENPLIGDTVTFTVQITNSGPSGAVDVVITDVVQSGFSYVAASMVGGDTQDDSDPSGVGLLWGINSLPVSGTTSVSFQAVVGTSGAYTNVAAVDGPGVTVVDPPGPTGPGVTILPQTAPDLAITVGAPAPTLVAGVTSYIPVTVSNVGTGPTTEPLTVTVGLPAGVDGPVSYSENGWNCTTTAQTVRCLHPGPLNHGDSMLFSVPITPDDSTIGTIPGPIPVTVEPPPGDPNPTNNGPTPVPIGDPVARDAQLTVVKSASDLEPLVGDTVTFTVQITNSGPSGAVDVVITDVVQSGFSYVAASMVGGDTQDDSDPSGVGLLWGINSLPVSGTTSVSFQAVVGTSGAYTNVAAVDGPGVTVVDPPGPTGPGVTILPQTAPDLAITVGAPAPTLVAGVTSYIPVTVSNVGTGPTTEPLTVTVGLPAGVDGPVSYSENGWNCTTTAQTVRCLHPGPLNHGDSMLFSVPITPDDSTIGTIPGPIPVTVEPPPGDPNPTNNGPTPVPIGDPVARDAQLTVVKSASDLEPLVGDTVTFTVQITNSGPSGAVDVVITDVVQSGFSYVAASMVGGDSRDDSDPSGVGLLWGINSLPVSGTTSVSFQAMVNAGGAYTNVAAVDGPGVTVVDPPGPTGPGVTILPQTAPDLAITVGAPAPTLVAGVTSYIPVTVSNVGTGPTTEPLTVTVGLPAGVDGPVSYSENGWNCTTTAQTVRCLHPGPLNHGDSMLFSVPITPDDSTIGTIPGPIPVTVEPPPGDPNPTNNGPTPVPIGDPVARDAQLTVVKSASDLEPLVGHAVTFTIQITNSGPSGAVDVVITDVVQSGFSYVAASMVGGDTQDDSDPTGVGLLWTINSLPVSGTTSVSFQAMVNAGGAYTNVAAVDGPGVTVVDPPGPTGPGVTILPQTAPDLAITVGAPAPTLVAGVTSYIPVTVSNVGTAPTTEPLTVTVGLPTGVDGPVSYSENGWNCTTTAQTVRCLHPGPLNHGDSMLFSVPITPDDSTIGTIPGPIPVTVEPPPGDPNPTNNGPTPVPIGDPVARDAQLTVVKSASDLEPLVGDTVTFTVQITNSGPSGAVDVVITDVVQSGFGYVAASMVGGDTRDDSDPSGVGLVWMINSLPVGGTMSVSFQAVVGTSGAYTNVAAVDGPGVTVVDPPGPTGPGVTILPRRVPDLRVSVGAPAPTLVAGVTSYIPVTVSNVGTAPTTEPLTVTVGLPAGMDGPVSYSENGWNCTTTAQTVRCLHPGPLNHGDSMLFSVPITPDDSTIGTIPGPIPVTVEPPPGDPNPTDNGPTPVPIGDPVARDAQLTVVKSVDEENPLIGDMVTFTVQITNNGPSGAVDVVITDVVQSGFSYVAASMVGGDSRDDSDPSGVGLVWTINSLPVAGTTSVSFQAVVNAGGAYTNVAAVDGPGVTVVDPPGPTGPGVEVNVLNRAPVIVEPATDSFTSTIPENTTFVLDLTVTDDRDNEGNGLTYGLSGVDAPLLTVDENGIVQFVSAPDYEMPLDGAGDASANGAAVAVAGAAIGQDNVYEVTVTVTDTGFLTDSLKLYVVVSNVPDTPELTLMVGQPEPVLVAGASSLLPVTVTNVGGADATGPLTVTITLPPGVTAPATVDVGNGWYCTTTGQTVSCVNAGPLPAGASSEFHLPVTADDTTVGTRPGPFTVEVEPAVGEVDRTDNGPLSMIPDVAVQRVATLTVAKLVNRAEAEVGDTITFTIRVTNSGPSAAANLMITDVLPSGFSYVGSSIAGGDSRDESDPAGVGLRWTINSLPLNGTVDVQLQATINPTGNYTNVVQVDGSGVRLAEPIGPVGPQVSVTVRREPTELPAMPEPTAGHTIWLPFVIR